MTRYSLGASLWIGCGKSNGSGDLRDESLFSGVDDFVWNWENKVEDIDSGVMLLSELRCNDMPQGAIAVSTRYRNSKCDERNHVLYVEYLENAPWNIKGNAFGVSEYLGVEIY